MHGDSAKWATCLLALVVSACSDQPDVHTPRSGQTDSATPRQVDQSGPDRGRSHVPAGTRATSRVPPELQFPGIPSVQIADSWETRLARMGEADRKWLERINASYAGALAFGDRKQQEWMIANGYPMPEEWLAARAMTDATLKRLAESGNAKARIFFIDRVAERSALANADGRGVDPSRADDRELLGDLGRAQAMVWRLSEDGRSPFAPLLAGRFQRANASSNSPEFLAAGIIEAGRRGDPRSDALLRAFVAANPNVDMARVRSILDTWQRPGT